MRVVGSKPPAPMMDLRLAAAVGGFEAGEQLGGFGVVRVEGEGGLDFAGGAGDVAAG